MVKRLSLPCWRIQQVSLKMVTLFTVLTACHEAWPQSHKQPARSRSLSAEESPLARSRMSRYRLPQALSVARTGASPRGCLPPALHQIVRMAHLRWPVRASAEVKCTYDPRRWQMSQVKCCSRMCSYNSSPLYMCTLQKSQRGWSAMCAASSSPQYASSSRGKRRFACRTNSRVRYQRDMLLQQKGLGHAAIGL